jgi:ATP-binding cassette subfamily B protein
MIYHDRERVSRPQSLLLVLQQGAGGAVIPLLGALALGAQRLLPSLQQVYNGWSSLKG